MSCQLIATDLDGTLLDDNKQISVENQKAILYAIKQGIKIIPCTGRAVQGVTRFPFLTDLNTLAVTYNGGMIVHLGNQEIVYHCPLEKNDSTWIIQKALAFDTNLCVWINNQLYCNKINPHTLKYGSINGVAPLLLTDSRMLTDNNHAVTKILWYDTEKNIARYAEYMEKTVSENVTCCTSMPCFLEFFNRRTSKALALQYIADDYGISTEKIMAFGDEKNDMSMLVFAGKGIAMANARDEVKAVADFVTLSNNDNGVAEAIYRFV